MSLHRRLKQDGFSLLEVMIVVLIIAVGAATVRLLAVNDNQLDDVEKQGHAFEFWFGRQLDQSLLSGQEIGMFFSEQSIAALSWREGDPDIGEPDFVWEPESTWTLSVDDNVTVELMLDNENRQWVALESEQPEDYLDLTPHLIILPSEEYQPSFTFVLSHDAVRDRQISVSGDGFNRLKVSRHER